MCMDGVCFCLSAWIILVVIEIIIITVIILNLVIMIVGKLL